MDLNRSITWNFPTNFTRTRLYMKVKIPFEVKSCYTGGICTSFECLKWLLRVRRRGGELLNMWGGIVNPGIRWNFYESRLYPSYSAQFLILFWLRDSLAIVTLCLAENALDLFHCRGREREELRFRVLYQRLSSILLNDSFRAEIERFACNNLIFTRVDIIQECVSTVSRYWSLSGPFRMLRFLLILN